MIERRSSNGSVPPRRGAARWSWVVMSAGAAALVLGACAVDEAVVARTDVIEVRAGGSVKYDVLGNDLAGPNRRLVGLGPYPTEMIAIDYSASGTVEVEALAAAPGAEFEVRYDLQAGALADDGRLIVRLVDENAPTSTTSTSTTTSEPGPTSPTPTPEPKDASLTVEPTAVDFGRIDLDEPVAARTLMLDNDGDVALDLSFDGPFDPFAVDGTAPCARLGVGESCELKIELETGVGGLAADGLTVIGRAADGRIEVVVPLRAEVVEPELVVELALRPSSIQLTQEAPSAKLVVENRGSAAADELLLPESTPEFEIRRGSCGGGVVAAFALPLPPGESCTFDINLTYDALSAELVDRVSIAVSSGDATASAEVTIDARGPGEISIDPSSITVIGAPREVLITNIGSRPLDGLRIEPFQPASASGGSGRIELVSSACPAVLEVDRECTIELRFDLESGTGSRGRVGIVYGSAVADLGIKVTLIE